MKQRISKANDFPGNNFSRKILQGNFLGNKLNVKRIIAAVMAATMLSMTLSGCIRMAPEEPTVPETVDGLSGSGSTANEDITNPTQESTDITSNEEQQQENTDQKSGEDDSQRDPKQEETSVKQEDAEQTVQTAETAEKSQMEEVSVESEQEDTDAQIVSAQGLDTKKLGWGPGGPTDADNRPDGATAYQEKYGKYNADFIRENNMNIYLTFDEGYENGYTSQILDVLKEKNVPAVFFVTMPYVKSEPELIQRMIDEGHIVGNHSVNHPSFPDTDAEQCKWEVSELHDYVKENFDYEMTLFRFPMGEFSEMDLELIHELGYRSVFWSFAYRDWLVDSQPDPQQAIQTIESKCHPGAIYLLHAVSATNAQVLGQVIDDLRAQGYTFCSYQ